MADRGHKGAKSTEARELLRRTFPRKLEQNLSKELGEIDWISGIRVTGEASGLAQPIEPKREDWLRGVDLNHRPLWL